MPIETILISLGIVLGVMILFLIGFVILKTVLFSPPPKKVAGRAFVKIDSQSVAERLGLAVQYKTIANIDQSKIDGNSFLGLHRLFKTLYPQVHSQLQVETVNDYSLLYTWEGKNPDLKPIMLISHMDVVPADESEEGGWTYPPFSGEIADGYVWGRGSLDDKNSVISILEAVEYLLKNDFQPERTVYLGFGHDEEIQGEHGAFAIAELLRSRGVELGSLLDEGGAVIEGFLPDIDTPVGAIGISEKGYLSLKLTVSVVGGHSSTPPKETAIGILAKAIANLENNLMPARLEVVEFLMGYLGSVLPFTQRMYFANTWLFGGVLKKQLAKSPILNATIRTTTAPTIIKAGMKDNILPAKAEAVVNFRILPGDDLRTVYEMVLARINDDRVKVTPLHGDTLEGASGWNPTPVADIESPYFLKLSRLIQQAYPEALVLPYLISGSTDARRYGSITENAFRFYPVKLTSVELKSIHGVNERITIDNCGRMVSFYIAYIQELSGMPEEADQVSEAPLELIEEVEEDLALSSEEMAAFEAERFSYLNETADVDEEGDDEQNEV